MADKIAQTHITRKDGVYFVSTINRTCSSPLAPEMRYAETMAWGPATDAVIGAWSDGRGPLIYQSSSAEGSIKGHLAACEAVFQFGSSLGDEEAERDEP